MVKNLYKGVIAMPRETFIARCYAYSETQAKIILARRVAKKHGVLPVVVNTFLKEHPACFIIEKEIEFKEVDDDGATNNHEEDTAKAATNRVAKRRCQKIAGAA